jgi:hypothetical protein
MKHNKKSKGYSQYIQSVRDKKTIEQDVSVADWSLRNCTINMGYFSITLSDRKYFC